MLNELQARTIANLGMVVAEAPDIQQIASQALQDLQQITGAAYLVLNFKSGGPVLPALNIDWAGNTVPSSSLSAQSGPLVDQVLTSQQRADYTGQGSDEENNSGGIGGTSLRRLVVLPMLNRARIMGTVTLGWTASSVDASVFQTAQLLANALGMSVENASLYHAQQSYIQALEYLGSLSMELNLLPDETEVLNRVTHIAKSLLNTERCAVFLSREDQIEDIRSCGLSEGFTQILLGADLHIWETANQGTASGSRAQVIGEAQIEAAGPEWQDAFRVADIQSGMIVLLRGHARLLGGIAVYYSHPYQPSSYELRLLEILAAQVSVALDNIELNDANEQHADMLEQRVAARTQELAIALDKAEDADRLKTQLLSTVSHELRTPLAVIKAHATTTLAYYDRLPKERQLHYLTTINEETDRLTALINSLLDMSRLEAGRLEIRTARIDPVGIFQDLMDVLQARFVSRNFTWAIPSELPTIAADEERVRQVVENLVDNASKYSPADTSIEVGARAWDDAIEVWVKDQGNGLTPEQTRRVFERFYQIDGSTTNARAGVGLGLAICKGLVEEMGGRIWCESAGPGKGSKFAFTLPWSLEESGDASATQPSPSPSGN